MRKNRPARARPREAHLYGRRSASERSALGRGVATRHARGTRPRRKTPPSIGRSLQEAALDGVLCGVVAGISFALLACVISVLIGRSLLTPFRHSASLALGDGALLMTGVLEPLVVGGFVHFTLSAAFGLIYGIANTSFSAVTQVRRGRQIALSVIYALVLWAINYQVIARVLFPWFLTTPLPYQLALHVLGFGVPLGLLYSGTERRAPRLWDVYA